MDKSYICDVCGLFVKAKSVYTLTTSQVVSSNAFWDKIMVQKEMKQIAIQHFINKSVLATQIRSFTVINMIVQNDTWAVCDCCIDLFNVNMETAKIYTIRKLEDPTFLPPNNGDAREILSEAEIRKIFIYAVMVAGYKSL